MTTALTILAILVVVLGAVVAAYVRGTTEGDGGTDPPRSAPPDPDLPDATNDDHDPDGGDGAADRDYWSAQHRDGADD